MSPNAPEGIRGPDAFGKRFGEVVLKLAGDVKMTGKGMELGTRREDFAFKCVVDIRNPLIRGALDRAFFPDLVGVLRARIYRRRAAG